MQEIGLKQLLLWISLMLALQVNAQECEPKTQECVEVGQWQFSVAVGAGVMTNPLVGGENLPLLVLPYVSYYRDKLFLDNTTIGYTFKNTKHFDVSIIAEPNTEQAYFERFHIRNLIAPESYLETSSSEGDSGILPDGTASENDLSPVKPKVSIDEVSKRKWTMDGGLLVHWYAGTQGKFTFNWLKDLGGVYQGQHATISYSHQINLAKHIPAKLQFKFGAHWQSKQLVDYYYGLRTKDKLDPHFYYRGESTISPFLSVAFNYRLNKQWQLKVSAKHKFFGSGISNSPLLKSHSASSMFVGGLYEF
ncbi:hypothetical protein PSECIP111951_04026 [Pseudoalteromonas holothuriae]|uniref:Outer membrane protein n=1 Tax=Pseudoalteromonas holothuriae TaxID=2963714 RepID=A0ABM9GQ70_9GAMM|nr:hypothetical protein PSECIP111951_04026 [Pseudoalteromonas sp. CIP111951]